MTEGLSPNRRPGFTTALASPVSLGSSLIHRLPLLIMHQICKLHLQSAVVHFRRHRDAALGVGAVCREAACGTPLFPAALSEFGTTGRRRQLDIIA